MIKLRPSSNTILPRKLIDFSKKQFLQIINPFPKVYRETKWENTRKQKYD